MIDLFILAVKQETGIILQKEYQFHPTRQWRFDYACPELMIAIEVEGGIHIRGRHVRPKGYMADMEKYNTATLLGWKVLRFSPKDVYQAIDILKTLK